MSNHYLQDANSPSAAESLDQDEVVEKKKDAISPERNQPALITAAITATTTTENNLRIENLLLRAKLYGLEAASEEARQGHDFTQAHLLQTISQMQENYSTERNKLQSEIEHPRSQFMAEQTNFTASCQREERP